MANVNVAFGLKPINTAGSSTGRINAGEAKFDAGIYCAISELRRGFSFVRILPSVIFVKYLNLRKNLLIANVLDGIAINHVNHYRYGQNFI